MGLLDPERYFSRVSAIDVARDVVGKGYSCVLLDIDNTIRSRADHQVPRDVRTWLVRLREAKVAVCLLSNNFHANAGELAAELGVPIVAKALKPLPHGFTLARRKVGGSHASTVMVGDQLSTDVLGAHLAGLPAYLVCPLAEEDLKHTMAVRALERVFIADREPEGASACETSHS